MGFYLTIEQVRDLARGAAVLGTGGGGDPLIGRLLVEEQIRSGKKIEILDPGELDDSGLVLSTAMMGAPTVVVEKVPAGKEVVTAYRALEKHLGEEAVATIPMECGGLNSMVPLIIGAIADVPVVDADGMGRAFPQLEMETFGVYGISGSPMVVADEHGHCSLIDTGDDNRKMEKFARAVTIQMGGSAYIAEYPMRGSDVKRTAVWNTMTLGINIGKVLREANEFHRNPFKELQAFLKDTIYGHGVVLFSGKIVDVERRFQSGFSQGSARIQSFDEKHELKIDFRNENSVAYRNGSVVAIVPDLISVMDEETGAPITTEALSYGQRVTVFGISTPEIMRSPEALDTFGPQAFDINHEWEPLEALSPKDWSVD
ncbi:DUF917 domain-containing protein [Brevibacterium sp. UMB1308A]|uniref:DUF917 domain-containing protein n=1 Tax=Brevibacterium sp. UMB1308A TaxID=3050608 RepID=UPI002551C6DB|nr:DUF917 domain-containing protein [Brevibacterium sp. UMB1308A]MDK8345248.1 DUF917 domain-containing protein [Brevibacterium sp. UMB1308B]MDK8713891.1 DUF917 domain-containing protein [Brevibacterium sp. UMB1308A]